MTTPLYQNANIPTRKPVDAHAGLWFERFFGLYDDNYAIADGDKQNWINHVTGYYWTHFFIQQQLIELEKLVSTYQKREIKDLLRNNLPDATFKDKYKQLNDFSASQKNLILLGVKEKQTQQNKLNVFNKEWEKFLHRLNNENLITGLTSFINCQNKWLDKLEGEQKLLEEEPEILLQNLKRFSQYQQSLITALDGESRFYKTDWHFVTGMGNPHPVENGFTWHPTLAVPFLAGSAVKGLVRAWVEFEKAEILEKLKHADKNNISTQEKNDLTEKQTKINQQLKIWFGTEDKKEVAEQAGNFIFFDALPNEPPVLLCDIMTPHMGKWYEQGDTGSLNPDVIPADWHEPVPVPFLAVKKSQFVFSIAARHPENKAHVEELKKVFEALDNALTWLGAGAKTAAGYGYMEVDNDATAALKRQADKAAEDAKTVDMTLEQRLVFKFQQEYEKAKQNPSLYPFAGCQLYTDLTQTITKAVDWSNEDKQKLLQIGSELNQKLWNGNKKVKERLRTLQ